MNLGGVAMVTATGRSRHLYVDFKDERGSKEKLQRLGKAWASIQIEFEGRKSKGEIRCYLTLSRALY